MEKTNKLMIKKLNHKTLCPHQTSTDEVGQK